MIPINRTYAPVHAFVDELARCGLRHAVTCPGSRNAPLALTLAGDERIEAISVLDERSAGFLALGIAKTERRPVVVTCTSGTAAANLLPAIVEARESHVPLIVLTADRPPELRDVGAGQAIDQIKLFGSFPKWFTEVGTHPPTRATGIHYRALACRAWFTSEDGRPGPVHLNFPLREPLAPVPEHLDPEPWQGRPDGRPWTVVTEVPSDPSPTVIELLERDVLESETGVIVCGPTLEQIPVAAARLAAATGWPILAEPASGVRCGPHDRSHVIAHYDALLRSERFVDAHRTDLVIRVGDTPTSKPLRAWLAGTRQIVIDRQAGWHEPTRRAERLVTAAADSTLEMLAAALETEPPTRASWLASWRAADAVVTPALAAAPDPFEPKAFSALADALSDGAIVWLGSSMPVRDVETFFPQTETALRFVANRGANGIDGTVSSAVGAALAGPDPCVLLTGELALLHDLGGALAARRHGANVRIVCINNGGGGIFDFLPVATHADPGHYREHIVTPAGVDLATVASLAGLAHVRAETPDQVRRAISGPALVEVRTDREDNVRMHREVYARVDAALSDALAQA
ncbi:MAG TPA: 2-succinyl-5-enolpyruvyl-6-hydroxy-3-cyclohexene-1-carboxylic-acid synthase [Thermoleophilaceae bacterium]